MSQLGNIKNSYGKQFAIAIANTTADNIMKASNLPKNTLILSAPAKKTNIEDLPGTAILVTDSYSQPILLTKTLKEGNGLVYKNDSIGVEIDKSTIKTNNKGELYIDINAIISNSLEIELDSNGSLSINNVLMQRASTTKFGVVKLDGNSIKSDNGMLYVDTSKIDHAANGFAGTVIGDNSTIIVNNGIPNVIVSNLDKCTNVNVGTMKVDGKTLKSENGVISANESDLACTETAIGLIKPDGKTINAQNGVLSANISGIAKASVSTKGTIRYRQDEFSTSSTGHLNSPAIADIKSRIGNLNTRIEKANSDLDSIEKEIASLL